MDIPNISGTDLNELSITGFYYGKEMINAPINSEIFIEHIDTLSNKDRQTIKVFPLGTVYTRFKQDDMWQSWWKFNDTTELWERV